MPESLKGEIKTSIVDTDELPFIPGERKISFVLQPKTLDERFVPPATSGKPFTPEFVFNNRPDAEGKKRIILDIETTGLEPFKSQIMCIGLFDPDTMDEPIVMFSEDESELIRQFVDFFEANRYDEIVGYNINFDYRFIYVKCMFYRIPCPTFFKAENVDLLNKMKQIKDKFVPTTNKGFTLDEWQTYFFGIPRKMTPELRLKLWAEGEFQPILDNNKEDIMIINMLYNLFNVTGGESLV